MDRISNEQIESGIKAFFLGVETTVGPTQADLMYKALTELLERREADSKKLDIKEQLRIVRDKCPNVWDVIAKDFDCPSMFPMGLQSDLIDSKDICCGIGDENCKECWDKALEGDKK